MEYGLRMVVKYLGFLCACGFFGAQQTTVVRAQCDKNAQCSGDKVTGRFGLVFIRYYNENNFNHFGHFGHFGHY